MEATRKPELRRNLGAPVAVEPVLAKAERDRLAVAHAGRPCGTPVEQDLVLERDEVGVEEAGHLGRRMDAQEPATESLEPKRVLP